VGRRLAALSARLARVGARFALAWPVLAAGAGFAFLARDLLGLPPPLVALAWIAGALAAARRRV
jgi:hypothetical protein